MTFFSGTAKHSLLPPLCSSQPPVVFPWPFRLCCFLTHLSSCPWFPSSLFSFFEVSLSILPAHWLRCFPKHLACPETVPSWTLTHRCPQHCLLEWTLLFIWASMSFEKHALIVQPCIQWATPVWFCFFFKARTTRTSNTSTWLGLPALSSPRSCCVHATPPCSVVLPPKGGNQPSVECQRSAT